MTQRVITWDEWWPVYDLEEPDEAADCYHPFQTVDVPDDLVERYEKAFAAYKAVQEEIEAIWAPIAEANRETK